MTARVARQRNTRPGAGGADQSRWRGQCRRGRCGRPPPVPRPPDRQRLGPGLRRQAPAAGQSRDTAGSAVADGPAAESWRRRVRFFWWRKWQQCPGGEQPWPGEHRRRRSVPRWWWRRWRWEETVMPMISKFMLTGALGLALTGCARSERRAGRRPSSTPDEAVDGIRRRGARQQHGGARLDAGSGRRGNRDLERHRRRPGGARSDSWSAIDEHHALVEKGEDTLVLNVGATDWPVPMPLVKAGGVWHWDGAAGRDEVFYRRIGHNELKAISVCNAVVQAQMEYAQVAHDGNPAGAFASRIMSSDGKQDGLYWPVNEGEPSSPLGPGVASAGSQGYDTTGVRTPYQGYFYRIVPNRGRWLRRGGIPGGLSAERRDDLPGGPDGARVPEGSGRGDRFTGAADRCLPRRRQLEAGGIAPAPDGRQRVKSMIQLVSHVAPASAEKACSQRAASAPRLVQMNRTRIIRPL